MVDILLDKYKVDEDRIFVAGWSNGAKMAYRLSCEMSDRIAAAASFVGTFTWKDTREKNCQGDIVYN